MTFKNIMYLSMLPAVILVPLWFQNGRLIFGGHQDFYGEFYLNMLCLPGVVVFHILMVLWELPRPIHQRDDRVAFALLTIYALHVMFQIFFFDEDSNHEHGWSVASKTWGISRIHSIQISLALGILIRALMIATVLKSYWTVFDSPDSAQPEPLDMHLVQERMHNTLRPGIILGWLWFGLGHSLLGAGFGWGGINLLQEGLRTVLPFHAVLWYCERKKSILQRKLAIGMMVYYFIQFFSQFFAWEGNRSGSSAATTFFKVPEDVSGYIFLMCYYIQILLMILILWWAGHENPDGNYKVIASDLGSVSTATLESTTEKSIRLV